MIGISNKRIFYVFLTTVCFIQTQEAFSIKKQAEATLNEENNLVSKIDEVKNSISETSGKINGFKQKAEVDHSTISQVSWWIYDQSDVMCFLIMSFNLYDTYKLCKLFIVQGM